MITLDIKSVAELKNKVTNTLLQTLPTEIKNGEWIRIEDCGKNVKKT
ncbi:hypothetical protein [Staphylococcus epidermidis]